jgi:hypothetical protein
MPRHFIVTIDTEGDNLWNRPHVITTRNAEFLPRFQSLCEAHGLKPTYLTNYEMATTPAFREFGRDMLKRGTGEIGMHLHAWNSPPISALTSDDFHNEPYLVEYPEASIREKVHFMTALLEETFGGPIVSHRAGRWAMSPSYARILAEQGYRVDCSVTPHVSWKQKLGNPAGGGGTDYSLFPTGPYFLDLDNLAKPGTSTLLEVPVTILSARRPVTRLLPAPIRSARVVQAGLERALPARWFRPTLRNQADMLRILDEVVALDRPYVEFVLHSSELMPGGSPTFKNERDIELLYECLTKVFEAAQGRFQGTTLAEYHQAFVASGAPAIHPAASAIRTGAA